MFPNKLQECIVQTTGFSTVERQNISALFSDRKTDFTAAFYLGHHHKMRQFENKRHSKWFFQCIESPFRIVRERDVFRHPIRFAWSVQVVEYPTNTLTNNSCS
ncbi:hypothetical protein NPIL_37651 [Nephila pilipes]|uniref:Uncharacterized protein n=1 Tax=Nephila pilipes TaxID=299642 RepID=A0A8X6NQ27_NEPPI|nr:hypothetical protein NPIL_37651 [Nephila pilipes]